MRNLGHNAKRNKINALQKPLLQNCPKTPQSYVVSPVAIRHTKNAVKSTISAQNSKTHEKPLAQNAPFRRFVRRLPHFATRALFCSLDLRRPTGIGCALMGNHPETQLPDISLPEPYFPFDVACSLIPCSRTALYQFLARHKDKFPPHYRFRSGRSVRRRYLKASEIKQIQDMYYGHTPKPSKQEE